MRFLIFSETVLFLFKYREVHCLQKYHEPPALKLSIELAKPPSNQKYDSSRIL